jgi:DNA polymerase epsilon subunit 4
MPPSTPTSSSTRSVSARRASLLTTPEGGPAKKKRVTKSRQSLAEKSKGTTIFPLTRVKRIIKADKDLDIMSSEATFLIAVATEYFIKHFMEEGYTKARLERRRIVNYKDLANVVARSEEFEFLRGEFESPHGRESNRQLRKSWKARM